MIEGLVVCPGRQGADRRRWLRRLGMLVQQRLRLLGHLGLVKLAEAVAHLVENLNASSAVS